MAGQLTIDTLKTSSGVLATQNGMTGIAKAWCNYNGSTQTITNSFNISSVTYNSTGNYTFNFTTAMPNATYSAQYSGSASSYLAILDYSSARTTSAINLVSIDVNGTIFNTSSANLAIFGS